VGVVAGDMDEDISVFAVAARTERFAGVSLYDGAEYGDQQVEKQGIRG